MIPGPHTIAAKEMRVVVASQREMTIASAKRESRLLERAEHQNVIRLFGSVFDDPQHVYLLMELADGGSLRAVLDADGVPSPFEQQSLASGIALGLAYLHGLDPPILHHDLKSDNVLLELKADGSRQPKIADFGLATGANMSKMNTQTAAAGNAGTQAYKGPECFNDEFTRASDVYAFAIIVWELLTADRPWANVTDAAIMFKVCNNGERPAIPDKANRGLAIIAEKCWAQSAADRPSFEELIAGKLAHYLVGPEFWCITRKDLDEFEEQVVEAHQKGELPQNPDHHDPNHDDPQIGPNMHNVVQHVVKTQTTRAGVSWALMKNRGGLKVDASVRRTVERRPSLYQPLPPTLALIAGGHLCHALLERGRLRVLSQDARLVARRYAHDVVLLPRQPADVGAARPRRSAWRARQRPSQGLAVRARAAASQGDVHRCTHECPTTPRVHSQPQPHTDRRPLPSHHQR